MGKSIKTYKKETAKLTETTPAEVLSCKKSDNKLPKTKTLHQKTPKTLIKKHLQETETETTPTININKQKKGILILSHKKRKEKKKSPPPKKKNAEENLQEIMAKNIKFPLTEGEVTRTEREIRPRAPGTVL